MTRTGTNSADQPTLAIIEKIESARTPDLEILLPAAHPARLCWQIVAGPAMASRVLAALQGKAAALPLFAIWLLALRRGVVSADGIAQRCHDNVGFRWLASGLHVDAKLLTDFRNFNPVELDRLLAEVSVALDFEGALSDSECLSRVQSALKRVAESRAAMTSPAVQSSGQKSAERRRRVLTEKVSKVESGLRAIVAASDAAAQRERDRLASEAAAQQKQRIQVATEQAVLAKAEVSQPVAAKPATAKPAGLRRPRPPMSPAELAEYLAKRKFFALTSLSWGGAGDTADAQFKRIFGVTVVVFVLLSGSLYSVKPPPVERQAEEKIPQRLTQLVEEEKAKPRVEKPKAELPKPKDPLDIKPKEVAPSDAPVEAKAPVEVKAKPSNEIVRPVRQGGDDVAIARDKASRTGLVAMSNELAALRSLSNTDSLRTEQTRVGAEGAQRQVERDLIGKTATAGSGGVATNTIAHAGGGSLEGRSTSKVAAPGKGVPSLADVERESKGGKRTAEEIKLAFDANKSAIYGIYRRALRDNPLLEGRVVLRLTVDPSGTVTACNIVSSGLKDPDLEAKLVARILLINFGTRPKLEAWTGSYQIDFVPAS